MLIRGDYMYSVVSKDAIIDFLSKYDIDYSLLSYSEQSIIIILSNILFLIFWFIVFYIFYRLFKKILRSWF